MQPPSFPFTVLDTETTGFIPKVNHVIEFASMRSENGVVADSYEQLFSVGTDIPPHIEVLTRIKTADLKDKPTWDDKREEVRSHIGEGTMIVGQNLGFDIGMLRGEGIDLSDRPWVDTSLLASLVFPELRSYSLGYLSRVLDLDHAPVHRALGDVKATYELFMRVWARLGELPSDMLAQAKETMSRAGSGYKIMFDALPDAGLTTKPSWMVARIREDHTREAKDVLLPLPQVGTVNIQEESLEPSMLQGILNACAKDESAEHWITVKNLDHALRHLSLPEGAKVLYPPFHLLDEEAAARMLSQDVYTVDEALASLKLRWFSPRTRNELALHGGEKDVWNGKLACTDSATTYVKQFDVPARTYILDHRQLLNIVSEDGHLARKLLNDKTHVIIDDASMLEDTATKALGAEVSLDDLRAAAQGDETLMRCTDVLTIWAEKVRGNEDQHFVTESDIDKPETKGISDLVREQLQRTDLTAKTRDLLTGTLPMFEKANAKTHVMWVELKANGGIAMHALPERVDQMLDQYLYAKYRVTLLAPPGCEKSFPETVPQKRARIANTTSLRDTYRVVSQFPEGQGLRDTLRNPPAGKTMMLVGSKRMIEQLFVEFTEELEKKDVTMICQGLSGGQNRMEAEFIAAAEPAIWLLTPWTYEGTELPAGTLDRVILESLPFDHPGHPIMQRRKDHWRNSFSEYAMARVQHRLFRLLRTFSRHRKPEGEIIVVDKRVYEKDYGRILQSYIEQFGPNETKELRPPTPRPAPAPKKPENPAQPSLF